MTSVPYWTWQAMPPFLVRRYIIDPFPLLSLPTELIVTILCHLIQWDFKDFRNVLIGLPQLRELVICLTNCPEEASGILGGVQCVREREYQSIMSSPRTKKQLAIMVVSPTRRHWDEQPRPLNFMGSHPLFDRFHAHLRDSVVENFIILSDTGSKELYSQHSWSPDSNLGRIVKVNRLKNITSYCRCQQPGVLAFPDCLRLMSVLKATDDPPIQYLPLSSKQQLPFPEVWSGEDQDVWLGQRLTIFPFNSFESYQELNTNLKNVHVDFRYRCLPPIRCSRDGYRVVFKAPHLETLTVNFVTPQCPLIKDLILPTDITPSTQCSGRQLVVHNMNWSPRAPCGSTEKCHTNRRHDQFHCSTASFPHNAGELHFMFKSYVLVGVPDTFLVYARWECVRSLYWKRLEPAYARADASQPGVILCPSLKHLKICHLVDPKVPLIRFEVPVLEQLVLESLPDSEQTWDIMTLLNNRWPQTLRKLALSSNTRGSELIRPEFKRFVIPSRLSITHLCLQRVDLLSVTRNLTLSHLVYLDMDVTVLAETIHGEETAMEVIFKQSQYPSLGILVLSVPLLSEKRRCLNLPILVDVPESCKCIGVANALAMTTITVNSQILRLPPGFIQKPLLELFTRYTKEEDRFVANGEMMAGNGESLDLLIETQTHDFDLDKRHCV